jgi:hypothetical protein
MRRSFEIDGIAHEVSFEGSPPFVVGGKEILSDATTDPAFGLPWYAAGYHVYPFMTAREHAELRAGIARCVAALLREAGVAEAALAGFALEHYHRLARIDALHAQVVARTRDLLPADFDFPVEVLRARLGELVGARLTDIDPDTGGQERIIIRIVRPGSSDFNPPHKDAYEGVDLDQRPKFFNFWLPVCAVTPRTSLPLAPGSHLLPEDQVLRTTEGGVMEGRRYRVRSVVEWGGRSSMTRPVVKPGEVLAFSPYLVHGLGFNAEPELTRVALEFRLFKA